MKGPRRALERVGLWGLAKPTYQSQSLWSHSHEKVSSWRSVDVQCTQNLQETLSWGLAVSWYAMVGICWGWLALRKLPRYWFQQLVPLSEFGTMKAQGCFACWASGSRNDLVRDLMPIPVAVPEGQSPYSETELSA